MNQILALNNPSKVDVQFNKPKLIFNHYEFQLNG